MLTARRLLGAFVAVAVGVSVVALSTLLFAAGRPQLPDRLADATVVVQSPPANTPADPFPPTRPWSARTAADLTARLAALPGVAAAVADRTFYVQALVDGRPHDAGQQAAREGHGWSSARLGGLRLTAGTEPRRPGEVVLDRALGLPPGAPVTLLTATGPVPYTVTGTLDAPGCYVADPTAATLSPGVQLIGLVLTADADPATVAAAAGTVVGADARVLTGTARGALEPRDDARTRWIGMQVLTATAALAAFMTIFVVAATFAFTVAQRRRELGLLRAVGATGRQLRRMLYREALAVGAAGALVGLAVGAATAPAIGRLLIEAGFEPASYTVRYTWWPLAVSFAVGPVVALLGVWTAARRASRVPPLEALRDAAIEQRPMGPLRWAAGGLSGAAGLALAVGTAISDDAQQGGTGALASAMALVTAAALLAPAVVPLVVRLLTWPARRGALGLLVRQGALTAARRTASTAAPVLLTIAFAVLVSGMVRTSTEAYAAGRSAAVNAGSVVVPDHAPGLSDAAVAGLPGAALLPTTVFTEPTGAAASRPLTALGTDPDRFAAANNRLAVLAGTLADLRGTDTVVVTAATAAALTGAANPAAVDRLPAVPLTVVFADGERVALRVAAVVTDNSLRGDLLLTRAAVRQHDPSALTAAVFIPGQADLPGGSGARIIDLATYAAEADSAEDRLVWLATLLLIGVSAGYGAIAVTNTLLMAAAGRRSDLRVLRLAGATRRQIGWIVAAESVLVVVIGAALGAAVAFTTLFSIRAGLSEQVGAPVALVVPWSVVGGSLGLCLVLAVAASVLPARVRTPAG